MYENIFSTDPVLSCLHQQLGNQIFCLGRDLSPVLLRELKLSLLDVVEKVQLTKLTISPLGPTTLFPTGPTKGRVATEQDVHHHSKTPQVTPLVILEVILSILNKSLNNLWSHKLCASNWCKEQWSGVGTTTRVELDAGAKIKVAEFDWRKTIIVDTENIFGLEVSMSNTLGVEKFKGRGHIRDYISRFLLGEIFPEKK